MKVKETGDVRPLGSGQPTDAARAPQAKDASTQDRVSTEETAKLEAALAVAKQTLGVSHSARLQAIEAQVRSGAFMPDPQRIASQILDDAELTAMLQAVLMH